MNLRNIIKEEFRCIFKDEGVLLLLIGALFIYSALYGVIYSPEVVHKIPVAVIDDDQTDLSHQMQRMLTSTPGADVKYNPQNMDQARALLLDRKISGILVIPANFQQQLLSGQQANVILYADGSYFLLYGNFTSNVSDVVLQMGANIKQQNLLQLGLSPAQATAISSPLDTKVETLFNPYGGYAASVMPAVLVVIIQQVLLLGIGMVLGTRRERRGWQKYRGTSPVTVLVGSTIVYLAIFIPLMVYVFGADYKFFGYPQLGSPVHLALMLLPYLLSVIFLGITIGTMMPRRESSVVYLVSLSLFFVMISGITWSRYVMPEWLYTVGLLFPSSSAVNGITLIRSCGASLQDVIREWLTLWSLTLLYGITAYFCLASKVKR